MFIRFFIRRFLCIYNFRYYHELCFKELCLELLKSSTSDVALKYFYVYCFGEQPYVFFFFVCVFVFIIFSKNLSDHNCFCLAQVVTSVFSFKEVYLLHKFRWDSNNNEFKVSAFTTGSRVYKNFQRKETTRIRYKGRKFCTSDSPTSDDSGFIWLTWTLRYFLKDKILIQCFIFRAQMSVTRIVLFSLALNMNLTPEEKVGGKTKTFSFFSPTHE